MSMRYPHLNLLKERVKVYQSLKNPLLLFQEQDEQVV
jgi:hypothetical protein